MHLLLSQSQSLQLSTSMKQSLEILQLNNLELENLISEITESNPFLEMTSTSITSNYSSPADYSNFLHQEAEVSLLDHLSSQIATEFTNAEDRLLAFKLCEYLDERGYFTGNLSELITINPRYKEVFSRLQSLDPSGIFAQNLSECLKIQLRSRNLLDNIMIIILDNLNDIANHKLKSLADKANISLEALHKNLKLLKNLTPYPAAQFSKSITPTLIPDLLLSINNTKFSIELNHDLLSNLTINKDYYYAIKKVTNNKEERQYMTHHFNHACSLLKAIQQRKQSLLKVAHIIIEAQKNFFLIGRNELQPLTLEEVAHKANLHLSTISRIVKEKYISTPNGIYPLKYFFSGEVNSHANTVIKSILAEIITNEAVDHILSDQELSEKLKERGYKVQRRTVTKYREMLNIPTSHHRKKLKHLQFT